MEPIITTTVKDIEAPKISKKGDEITLISANAEEGSVHTFSEEEKVAYSKFINERLSDQENLKPTYIEIDPSTSQLFTNCKDGVLLNKLMESLFPTLVKMKGLVIKKNINPFEIIQNQNLVIENALKVGCIIVNIGAQDLIDAKEYLVLGIIWQIIKSGLLSIVNQNANEMLGVLFDEPDKKEVIDSSSTTPNEKPEKDEHSAEEILMRWVNFHLEKAQCNKRLRNFSEDIQDSIIYANLLHQLLPNVLDDIVEKAHKESNLFTRAELITSACEKMKVKCFLTPSDIALGHPKLNLALVALLFNSEASIHDMRREREEKIERERVDRERVEREKKEKEIVERERVERERIEREKKEQDRFENERITREKEEKDRLERERLELERQERERIEREVREKMDKERQERERQEREELERRERERQEREEIERKAREALEKERLEREALEKSESERLENVKEYRIAIRMQKRMVDDPSLTDNMTKLVGEIVELKRNIVGEIRNTRSLQAELLKSTKNIDKVLENKKAGKKLKKTTKKIKPVKGVPNGLEKTKMNSYQQLFYYLQTEPQVMGKLLYILNPSQINKSFQNLLLSLFPYEISPKEEDLFLKALSVSLEYQIAHTATITDLFSERSVPMIVLNDYFQKKGLKYLREVIAPIILKVLDQKELNLNFDPLWIYKELVIEKEIKEGKKQEKNTDITFEQALDNPEVRALYESRQQQVVEIGMDFYTRIIKSLDEIPVQLRYLCRVLSEKVKSGFKTKSAMEDAETHVTHYLFIYRLIGAIISSPDLLNELVLQSHPYIPKNSRLNLSMISRFIQSMFTNKTWMTSFPIPKIQDAIKSHGKEAQEFLKKICAVPDLDELIHYKEYNQIMMENNIRFCTVINLTELIWLHETILESYYDLVDIGISKNYESQLQSLASTVNFSEKRKYQTSKRTSIVIGSNNVVSENNWWLKNTLDYIDQPLQLPEQGDRSIQLTFLNKEISEKDKYVDPWREAKIWMVEILSKSQPPKKDQNTIDILSDALAFFKTGNSNSENMTLISKAQTLIDRIKTFPTEQTCSSSNCFDLFLLESEKELESILRKNKLMRSELTRLHSLLKQVRIDSSPLPSLVKFQNEQLQKTIAKKELKHKQFDSKSKDEKSTHKFSLADLIKKGMIVSCDLHEAAHSKVTIVIRMIGPGLFDIDAKFAMASKTVQLELDSLLDYSKNHISEFPLDGIVLDVNMTIHTLMKLFNLS